MEIDVHDVDTTILALSHFLHLFEHIDRVQMLPTDFSIDRDFKPAFSLLTTNVVSTELFDTAGEVLFWDYHE